MTKYSKLIVLVTVFVVLGFAAPVDAQRNHLKDHQQVRRSFRSTVDETRQSTVRVLSKGKQIALGAIVDQAGLVISKSSEIVDEISCQLPNYRHYRATVIARDTDHDLALLKLEGKLPDAIVTIGWSDSPAPSVGSWLATVDLSQDPIAIGVVSVMPRRIEHERGFLGIGLDQGDEGAEINEVIEDSSAKIAGLTVGDVITHVNDKRVKRRADLMRRIGRMRPGDAVMLRGSRNGKDLEVKAVLGRLGMSGERASRLSRMNALGGPLSTRRADFPLALQHDTVLKPHQCGGPIVDMDGNVVGINIARAGRTSSLALPSDAVAAVVDHWKNDPEFRGHFHNNQPENENSSAATNDRAVD